VSFSGLAIGLFGGGAVDPGDPAGRPHAQHGPSSRHLQRAERYRVARGRATAARRPILVEFHTLNAQPSRPESRWARARWLLATC